MLSSGVFLLHLSVSCDTSASAHPHGALADCIGMLRSDDSFTVGGSIQTCNKSPPTGVLRACVKLSHGMCHEQCKGYREQCALQQLPLRQCGAGGSSVKLVMPWSTGRFTPLMCRPASLARNTTTWQQAQHQSSLLTAVWPLAHMHERRCWTQGESVTLRFVCIRSKRKVNLDYSANGYD